MTTGRAALLDHFRWVDGHADIWRVFAEAVALRQVVAGLAESWRNEGVTRVVGIESRGFLLGGAVAVALGARALVEECRARLLGLSLAVDMLDDRTRAQLGRVTALVRADELGPS